MALKRGGNIAALRNNLEIQFAGVGDQRPHQLRRYPAPADL